MKGLSTGGLLCIAALFAALPATAHVSERGLVLLLPTQIYIRSGVIAVALTVAPWLSSFAPYMPVSTAQETLWTTRSPSSSGQSGGS